MNLVALEKEIDRIADELRLSGEYTYTRFVDVRAELDRLKLEVEIVKRVLKKAFPSLARDFEEIKKEMVQQFNPELERADGKP